MKEPQLATPPPVAAMLEVQEVGGVLCLFPSRKRDVRQVCQRRFRKRGFRRFHEGFGGDLKIFLGH